MMLNRDRAVLVVVDIQEVLLPKSAEVVESYLSNAERMIRAARVLGVPVLVTEQNPERLGGTHPRIAPALEGIAPIPKMEFGCLANAEFREALEGTGRSQIILTGMEAHVCVSQTALAALAAGYEVFVASDAVVSSSKREYKAGMRRMTRAGAVPVSVLMAVFEMLGRAGTPEFRELLPLLK